MCCNEGNEGMEWGVCCNEGWSGECVVMRDGVGSVL